MSADWVDRRSSVGESGVKNSAQADATAATGTTTAPATSTFSRRPRPFGGVPPAWVRVGRTSNLVSMYLSFVWNGPASAGSRRNAVR